MQWGMYGKALDLDSCQFKAKHLDRTLRNRISQLARKGNLAKHIYSVAESQAIRWLKTQLDFQAMPES